MTDVHLLSISSDERAFTAEEMEDVTDAIEDAFAHAGLDDEIVLVAGELDAVGRQELIDELRDDSVQHDRMVRVKAVPYILEGRPFCECPRCGHEKYRRVEVTHYHHTGVRSFLGLEPLDETHQRYRGCKHCKYRSELPGVEDE